MSGDVLSIYGSPQRSGFSSTLHDMLLMPFREAEVDIAVFNSHENKVLPCDACLFCNENNKCSHDDMSVLYQRLFSCSILTVSTPIYFSGVVSTLKAVIDRCQFLWHHKEAVKPKHALFIAAAGSDYSTVFQGALITIKHFFKTINASFDEEDFIFIKDTDKMKRLPDEILERARNIGEKYVLLNKQDYNS